MDLIPAQITLILSLTVSPAVAADVVDAIAKIESGGNITAVGDHSRSLGMWQIQEQAWHDMSRIRRLQGRRCYPWKEAVNPVIAREYACDYVHWIAGRLQMDLKRPAKASEIYAAWNLGYDGFQRREFQLARCPRATRLAAQRLVNIL